MREPVFVDSIKLYNGRFCNITCHEDRINKTRTRFFGPRAPIQLIPSDTMREGLYKCRIEYSREILSTAFLPYSPKQITSLQIVYVKNFDYSFKYRDRSQITELFNQRGTADDVLIVNNGFVSDSSFANIAFYGEDGWVTPDTPLLCGTKRRELIEKKILRECRITPDDIKGYSAACLINAMNEIGTVQIQCNRIFA